MGELEGCENPECPQKSGGLGAPRSPRDGEGVEGAGGGVPRARRRAPLRSRRCLLGPAGRLGPSARQGKVGGVKGGDTEVVAMGGQGAGAGGKWLWELTGMVSDCCVWRAPGGLGLGERRPQAREFGNGRAESAGWGDQEAVSAPQTIPLTSPHIPDHNSQCRGWAPRPGDQCCCCWWWCQGGRGAGKGRKARRRWLLLVKRWSPSATSELCSL